MAVGKDSFFQYKESRALSGYRSAWLVKWPGTTYYSLIGATETVPYVFGDNETFDFNLLQSPVIGQVQGKMELESQDIDVLHNRDNAYRYNKLRDQVLDFMVINAEYVGYKFSGTISYRPQNAEADINRATVTIVPMDASVVPVYDARPEIRETLCFANDIPATISSGGKIDFSVKQSGAEVTVKAQKLAADGTETEAGMAVTTTNEKEVTFSEGGLYVITVSADEYAPWSSTVYVEAAE